MIAEEPSRCITVRQGSVWGISPKTAQKHIRFGLSLSGSGTRITSTSKLSRNYIRLALAGFIFALALIVLCFWISFDLAGFETSHGAGFWSWLVTTGSHADYSATVVLADLTRTFAILLAVVLFLEAGILVYVRFRVEGFAEEILQTLS